MKNLFKLILTLLMLCSVQVLAQQSFEITIGIGGTAVDVEQRVAEEEISGSIANDWEVIGGGISAQYIFSKSKNIGFGAELMYHYLYWYEVQIPFGTSDIFRAYDVDALRISGFARFGMDKAFSFDIGPSLNFMDDTNLGLLFSANYYIPVSDKISIPLKARIDLFSATVITVPITLNGGVRVEL